MSIAYMRSAWLVLCLTLCAFGGPVMCSAAEAPSATPGPLTLVVMDPLALPLSCPCVKGYAQRDYTKLATALETKLGRKVKLIFNESLTSALNGDAEGKADLIIGKHSVVLFDGERSKVALTPVAMLSGKDGSTTQTGLIVVPKDDPAQNVADLKDYRMIFGPQESAEKHAAALALLKKHQVSPPQELETSAACDEGACLILELGPKVRGCALISSYAKPLLEGCGTIQKGDLRVVGETEPVPFVGAFVNATVSSSERAKILAALVESTADPRLQVALETKRGFLPIDKPLAETAKKK